MPIDKLKNQRKGFCFVTFDNEQVVHELLKTPKQRICGKEVRSHLFLCCLNGNYVMKILSPASEFY